MSKKICQLLLLLYCSMLAPSCKHHHTEHTVAMHKGKYEPIVSDTCTTHTTSYDLKKEK